MNKPSRYLVTRLVLVTVLLSILLGLAVFFVEMITFDAARVWDWAKKSWSFLTVLCQLPLIIGVSYVFAMFYVTGFSLRESDYLKGAAGIPFAELFPSYLGVSLFVTIIILVFTVFIRPAAAVTRQALLHKMEKNREPGRMAGDRKVLQEAVSLYYKGRYRESRKLLVRFLKKSPHNRLGRMFFGYVNRELDRLKAAAPARNVNSRLFQEGFSHYRGGRYYKAIASFRRLLRAKPKHGPARKYLMLSRYALQYRGRSAVINARRALRRRIAEVLRKGIDAFDTKKYWESWAIMKDVLSLDPFNETAKSYLNRSRQGIVQFDFFPEEERDLHLYPARQAVFLPFGKNRFIYASWFIRKRTAFYLQRAWVFECAAEGGLRRAIRGGIGKWVHGKLVLRRASVFTPNPGGFPAGKKALRISVPSRITPERLWDASGLLEGIGYLDPLAIINLVSYFSSSRFSLLRLKLAFTEVFALPAVVFCFALLAASWAWRSRYTGVSMDKRFQVLLFLFIPFFVYFMLSTGVRLLMALTRIGVSMSPFFSYFNPITAAFVLLLASFSVFYRTARILQ